MLDKASAAIPIRPAKKRHEDTLKFSCDKTSMETEGCNEFHSECRFGKSSVVAPELC